MTDAAEWSAVRGDVRPQWSDRLKHSNASTAGHSGGRSSGRQCSDRKKRQLQRQHAIAGGPGGGADTVHQRSTAAQGALLPAFLMTLIGCLAMTDSCTMTQQMHSI